MVTLIIQILIFWKVLEKLEMKTLIPSPEKLMLNFRLRKPYFKTEGNNLYYKEEENAWLEVL